MCDPKSIKKYGAQPTNIQWTVVRGDTGTLKIEFYNKDEVTSWDTTGWSYNATVYNILGDELDSLDVEAEDGYVTIIAPASITENWGTQYKSVVAELPFNLQVTIPSAGDDIIWTPVIGTICVLGDITPSGGL